MFPLSIQSLNWASIKNSSCLLCCILLFGCSSTQNVKTHNYSQNNYFYDKYENQYENKNDHFYSSHFTQVNKSIHQNTLHSDHQLMMSLLNRPITEDQTMMIAFEQERMNYSATFTNYSVEIKGSKSAEQLNYRAINFYSNLISQDINAVVINAPN